MRETLTITISGAHDMNRVIPVARTLGVDVMALSIPEAAGNAGPAWFAALIATTRRDHPDIDIVGALDCGAAAGAAQAAISVGVDVIIHTGPDETRARLASLAQDHGVIVLDHRPPSLRLLPKGDMERACRDWLSQWGGKR